MTKKKNIKCKGVLIIMWFDILKIQTKLYNFVDYPENPHGKITHFHGSKAPKEKIMQEGLLPKGQYIQHKRGYGKPHHKDLMESPKNKKTKLIWAAGKEQGLPLEYGQKKRKEVKVDYNSLFDEKGNLLPNPAIKEEIVTIDGNMIGIRGENIDWDRAESPIYQVGTQWYISNKPISPDKLVFMTIEEWKKYLDKT